MSDAVLRDQLKAYQAGALDLDQMYRAIRRHGFEPSYGYTVCHHCNPETRCDRVGLCYHCSGDGWTEQYIVGWVRLPART